MVVVVAMVVVGAGVVARAVVTPPVQVVVETVARIIVETVAGVVVMVLAKTAVGLLVQEDAVVAVPHVPLLVLVVAKAVQVAMERVADARDHARVAMDVLVAAVLTVTIAVGVVAQVDVAVLAQIHVHQRVTPTAMEHAVHRHLVRQ